MGTMDWVKDIEDKRSEESAEGYFKIEEGDNRIQLLTHLAQLPLVWDGTKYRPAVEGDKNLSIKGVGWILQEGKIKEANLPYTVVKAIKELMEDPDYAFESFPMPRLINIKAKGAGTKEVTYTVIPSPKETEVASEILKELKSKISPEEIVERKKGKSEVSHVKTDYPEDVAKEDIPF